MSNRIVAVAGLLVLTPALLLSSEPAAEDLDRPGEPAGSVKATAAATAAGWPALPAAWRDGLRAAMKRSRQPHSYAELASADGPVRELLWWHEGLRCCRVLLSREQESWQRIVGARLHELAAQLRRQQPADPAPETLVLPPAEILGQIGQAGAAPTTTAPEDHGQRLVELIENTVAPRSWQKVGGPGSIQYWPPRHALVVRQTGSAHYQLNDLLVQLRK